jgi:integrase
MIKLRMRLYKRSNGNWYVELRRGVARSLGTTDAREAKVRFREIEREAIKGKLVQFDSGPNITLQDYLAEYLKWLKEHRAFFTWERMERINPKFVQAVGNKLLSSITGRDLENYMTYCKGLKNSPVTINTECRHIKCAFNKAVEWEYLKQSPFRFIKSIRHYKKHPNIIEKHDDIKKVFEAIGNNKKYRLAFALYIYTGARRSEIHKLTWSDIKGDYILFRERKNREMLNVPIVPKLKEILDGQRKDVGRLFDMSLDQLGRQIKYYLREAGLGHLKPHDLRHTFASHLLMSGVDITTVRKLLGQNSLHATKIYAHILDDHKKQEIRKLPY